jgi:type IV pilus assembly protein PilC
MLLYSWIGVNASGVKHTGQLCALSLEEVHALLSAQQIGLIHLKDAPLKALTRRQKDAFFLQLASLLCAHIPLYQSLCTMRSSQRNAYLQMFLDAVARHIAQGATLSDLLEKANMLDSFSREMILVGEATGTLGPLLQEVVTYRAEVAQALQRFKSAVRMPLLTLLFFVTILCGLLIWVIPSFEHFFELSHAPVPQVTSWLFMTSRYMTLKIVGSIGSVLMSLLFVCCLGRQSLIVKGMLAWLLEHTPYVGSLHRSYIQSHVLKVLSMLLAHHVPLARALVCCQKAMVYTTYRKALAVLKDSIDKGESCAIAWSKSSLSHPDIEVLLGLGESSGRLADMMLLASQAIDMKVQQRMHHITLYSNPVMLIFVAGLVAMLVYSIYIPLIDLSSIFNA